MGVLRALVLAAVPLLAGCDERDPLPLPRTIRVAVSTDLVAGEDLDGLRITVLRGGSEVFGQTYDADVVAALPDSLLLENAESTDDTGDPILTRVDITVVGTLGGEDVVARAASLVFQIDEAKLLRMPLCDACVGVACGDEETCIRGACAGRDVTVDALPADGEGVELAGECAAD